MSSSGPSERGPLLAALERFGVEAVGLTLRAMADVAAEADLTLSQWRALVVIDALPGSRVRTIATQVGMSMPSTNRLIRGLERAGVVALSADPADGRATVVYPTDGGSAFRTLVAERRQALLREALGDRLPAADPTVVATINTVTDALAASSRSR